MLHKIKKNEIRRASIVLADAFQTDPLWDKIFAGKAGMTPQFQACFEMPLRFCHHYGEVYASSQKLEGVSAWVPGSVSEMTFWRIIRSGAIFATRRMDADVGRKMMPIFAPLEKDRKQHMQERPYLYLFIIGVAHKFQGQGYGGRMLRALIEKSDQSKMPLYLETETEKNVELYLKFGFTVIKKTTLPLIHQPMWQMVREPAAGTANH